MPPSVPADDGVATDGGGSLIATGLAGVRRHRRWAAGAAIAALVAAAVAYAAVPRRYAARADVWLDHGFAQAAGVPAARDDAANATARNTEIRLLTSNDLAAQVVDRLGLAAVRDFGQPRTGPQRPPELARRTAIAVVRDNVTVQPTGTSYAVSVRYRALDPVLAAGVLNQLIDRYVEDRRIGGARGRARESMRAQVSAARDEMIRADAAATGYQAATSLVRKDAGADGAGTEIAGLEAALASAQAEQRSAEARLRAVTVTGTPTSPHLQELLRQQEELRSQRVNGQAPPSDPRLAALDRDLDLERGRLRRIADAATAARERAGAIGAALARARDEQRTTEEAARRTAQLGREADTARARFANESQRFDALVAAQRGQRGTAYVIAHAQPRSARSYPSTLLFALGGLAAALAAAGLVVLARELLTKGFRDRRHAERLLGLPVIGMVPDLTKVRGADVPADDPMAPADYLYNHQRSAFSAAFRAIHTGLRLGRGPDGTRAIAISSAFQEEGKTTVAICLARSAALAGLRVVLVDCDARRPAASRALSAYTPLGLAEVLEDRIHFRQALQTDTPSGAWFLAHGNDRAVANGVIRLPAMAELVATLRREFDLVVLDTPPALALVEAREIAALADAVLLVARARRTPVEAARIARDELAKAGAKVKVAALTLVAP